MASERERSSSESEHVRRCWRRVVVAALVAATTWLTVGCAAVGNIGDAPADASPGGGETLDTAIVERVIDGDTVDVQIGEATERVRLIGVDAPESVARNVPVQCFGAEASAALTELLPPGTILNIRRDVEARDHYGRLLLYLYRQDDDLFVNAWLIEAGLAEAVSYEPNVAYETMLTSARQRAATDLVGLWASCDGPDQPLE